MGRCACCLFIIVLVAIIVADALIFSYYISKFDAQSQKVSAGDMVQVDDNISTFWCDGVSLSSSLEFDAFKLQSAPRILEGFHNEESHKMKMKFNKFEYNMYRFYLLEGSTLKISVCSSEPLAIVSVFESEEEVTKCLTKRSTLDSEEEDYDDIRCPKTLLSSQIMVESSCERSDWVWWRSRREGMDVANMNIYNEGYYYILVQDFYYHGDNNIKMEVNLSRTVYDTRQRQDDCIANKNCHFDLDFWSDNSVVAHILPLHNSETYISTTIYYYCDLNEIVLICVFVAAPLLVILILGCLFCCCCRKKKVKHEVYIKKGGRDDQITESLLGSIASEDNSVFKYDIDNKNYGATMNKQQYNATAPQPSTTTAPQQSYYQYPPPPPATNPNIPPAYPNAPPAYSQAMPPLPNTNPGMPQPYYPTQPTEPAPPYTYKS